jgi:hypothetical protein
MAHTASSRLHRALLVLLATGPLLATGCAHDGDRLRIDAGPVQATAEGATGSFRIRPAREGLPSKGNGGACLLLERVAGSGTTTPCTQDTQCPVGLNDRQGSFGYCLPSTRDDGSRSCWIRPGPAASYCLQYKTSPAPLGVWLQFPRTADGTPAPALAPPGRWRVHACLNGLTPAACATPGVQDRQTDDGPVRRIGP